MRRRGERGHLPGKSVPQRVRPTRVEINEDVDSGVYREPASVDKIMASKFKGEDHIEKFPHGFDPFTEGKTSLKKKVVFRPNKHQLDAIKNRKKTISVNAESKVNGQGPVQHEKQFSSKNVNYVELKTYALSGLVNRGEHEQPILDKKSRVIETSAGIDSGHTEDTEAGHMKTVKQRKNTQAVDNVTTNADYMEYEPLFISKSEMAKAHYRKNNSIREDFNTKADPNQIVVERETVGKSSRVKNREHDVVAEETQANFDGYEIDGDQEIGTAKPRKQRDQSEYTVENQQDYEEGVEPLEDKPRARSRKQKDESAIEARDNISSGTDRNTYVKSKFSRQQKLAELESRDDMFADVERNTSVKIKVKRSQKMVDAEAGDDYGTQLQGDYDASQGARRPGRRQEIAETNQDYQVEGQRDTVSAKKSTKSTRHQAAPSDLDTNDDYGVEVEPQMSKHDVNKNHRRQKTDYDEDAVYAIDAVVDGDETLYGQTVSRQAKSRNLEQDASPEHSSNPEISRFTSGKSRRHKQSSNLDEETIVDYEIDGGVAEDRSGIKIKPRRQQGQAALETHDEAMTVYVQRPSIGRMKSRRQTDQSGLEETAEAVYQVEESQNSKPVKTTSRRHQAEVADYRTYDEEPVVNQKDNQAVMGRVKNNRQTSVDKQDAEINHFVVEPEHDKSSRKKASRQTEISGEEAEPEYLSNGREKSARNRSKASRQKAAEIEEAIPEYSLDKIDQDKNHRSRSSRQTPVKDQMSEIEGVYVEGSGHRQQAVQHRHVTTEAIDSGDFDPQEYVKARDETEIRKKIQRQKAIDDQDAGIDYDDTIKVLNRQNGKTRRRVQFAIDIQPQDIDLSADFVMREDEQSKTGERRKTQGTVSEETAAKHDSAIRNQASKEKMGRRKTQGEAVEIESRDYHGVEIEPQNHVRERQQRDRQSKTNEVASAQESEARVEIETRDARVVPNSRPVKHQAQTGVMIAIRAPQLDVKTRIEQALEKSRKQNALVEQQDAVINLSSAETGVKVEEIKGSNRRQYSAKQDQEESGVMVSGHRTDANDANKNSNRRQQSAAMNGDNRDTMAQSDLEIGTRLVADKQKVDGRVDEADVTKHSGMLNPVDEDAGIDPVSLEAANAKKHVAREGSLETTPDTILYEDGASKTGLETNTRSRVLMIDPSIFARGQAPTLLRRKKKL